MADSVEVLHKLRGLHLFLVTYILRLYLTMKRHYISTKFTRKKNHKILPDFFNMVLLWKYLVHPFSVCSNNSHQDNPHSLYPHFPLQDPYNVVSTPPIKDPCSSSPCLTRIKFPKVPFILERILRYERPGYTIWVQSSIKFHLKLCRSDHTHDKPSLPLLLEVLD